MPNAPLSVGMYGDNVAHLQDFLRQQGFQLPTSEVDRNFFGPATRQAVQKFQQQNGLPVSGTIDEQTANAISAATASASSAAGASPRANIATPLSPEMVKPRAGLLPGTPGNPGTPVDKQAADATIYTIMGTVTSPDRAGIGSLLVQVVDKTVGPDVLLVEATTDEQGSYNARFMAQSLLSRNKMQPDLQARVYAGQTFLAASDVHYNATTNETLNVNLPANLTALPSEYETLTSTLAAHYTAPLGELQETSDRQDITYLANKTGWDARLVALAALADQFSQITAPTPIASTDKTQARPMTPATVSLRPEFYYALFRAGLQANADSLFLTGTKMVMAIWQQAITQGVIPQALANDVPGAVQSFQTLSAVQLLKAGPRVGLSTFKEMLQTTLPNAPEQEKFAQIYTQYHGDWNTFWPALEQVLGAAPTKQLQLVGQLFYLTVNNAPLVNSLMKAEAQSTLSSTLDLATRGYYNPAKWMPLIGESIPPGIQGANVDEQRSNYAQMLAAQVRVSFPTAVLADQVKRGFFPIADTAEVATGVVDFLTVNQGQFHIGVQPVESYIAQYSKPNDELARTPVAVVTQIKRLQRVLQLTPDDMSMAVLLGHNLDSAFAITRYDSAGFVRAFQDKLGGGTKASTIHARAKQVFAAVLSVAVAYLNSRVAPTLGGRTPVHYSFPPQSSTPTSPVIAYPTLEDLFGSLDYCNCPDCGSILSPAAYLVDLLHYLDQPAPTGNSQNPQDVLFQRRPDLQYLPLTCENTNIALPYIDIVNETLEYCVANYQGQNTDNVVTLLAELMANYQGHDTGDIVTSAELLASPQFVNDAAYTTLQHAFFPPPLPYNRPLALLRLHMKNLGVSLPDAMIALRANDLVNSTSPTSFGWSDILIEQLTISRDEYRLFTDSTLQLGDLYGLPNATALSTLQQTSLQDFSRRLGVSYEDLSSIIQTQFINPNAILIPRLQRLNMPFITLQALQQNLPTNPPLAKAFINALPAGLDAMQYGGSNPIDYQAVVNWVIAPDNYARIMDIITLSNPDDSADTCTGAAWQFRYSNPDNTKNLLSGTDFVKLIRFIRLWQKLAPLLGDTDSAVLIAQTDAILTALYPAADIPIDTSDVANDSANRTLLDAGFKALLPRLGFLFQVMKRLSLTADAALVQLLACWAPIGTVGTNALYRRMFLSPTLLRQNPGVQTATIAGPVTPGDRLTTTINGVVILSLGSPYYSVVAGDTPSSIATNIAAAINATTSNDPFLGVPLNTLVVASSNASVVTITATNVGAPFTLACSYTPVGTYVAEHPIPAQWEATITGGVNQGDTLITTINGVAISYSAGPADTDSTKLAASIVSTINTAVQQTPITTQDPTVTLPMSSIVHASSRGNIISITAFDPTTPFELACQTSMGSEIYTASGPFPESQWVLVQGTFAPNTILTTTINGVVVFCPVVATDTPASITAKIVANINATATLNSVVTARMHGVYGGTFVQYFVIVTALSPATPFALTVSQSSGSYIAGWPISPFEDNGYGGFLAQNPPLMLSDYKPLLCAACNLTGAEFALITTALAFGLTTPLTLANVSALFRYGWLAHTLGISILVFLRLSEFTGLNPFASADGTIGAAGLDPGATSPTEPPIIRFIRLLQAIAAAGLAPVQALYLLWNQDISGKSAPPPTDITGLALTLRADFAAVETQFTLKDDPDGSIAQGLMTLVYGSTASGFFFGLLNNTFTTSITYSTPPGQPTLPQPVIDASTSRLSYDDLRKQLSFSGVLDAATQTMIANAITASATDPNLVATVARLAVANQQAVGPFFATYSELVSLYAAYVASTDPLPTRRTTLLNNFLPILKQKRKQEQALASITSAAATDPSFANALLQDPTILHADADPISAAVADLTAIEAQGLSAQFFLTNNTAATPDQTLDAVPLLSYIQTATIAGPITINDVLTTTINAISIPYTVIAADTTLAALAGHIAAAINATASINQVISASTNGSVIAIGGLDPSGANNAFSLACSVSAGATETYTSGSQLPTGTGGGPIAGMWSGYLTVPQDGFYDISITTDPGAGIMLQIGGATVIGKLVGSLWSNQSPISLGAGALVPIVLTVTSLKMTLSVSWKSLGLGWEIIPGEYLYSLNLVNRLGDTYVRFLKAASLATALSLTANEIAYLGTATTFSVNTTSNSKIVPGNALFAPASMNNIAVGSVLLIDRGSTQETVTVTATTLATLTTPATFSAVAVNPHDGTVTPFVIIDQSFPTIGQGWLNTLAVAHDPDLGTAVSLCSVLMGLLDFARIKHALSPGDERLLAVLQNPVATLPNNPTVTALLSLTGWNQVSVDVLLTQFFGNAQPTNVSSVEHFRRVYDAYALVKTCRVTALALISAVTNAPSATTVSALQSALRALYAESDWLIVIRPINDTMRIQQRDALVAYILQQLGDSYALSLVTQTTNADAATGATQLSCSDTAGVYLGMLVQGTNIAPGTVVTATTPATVTISTGILATLLSGSNLVFVPENAVEIATPDKLFEYFLIDVETQPPVETSRIRLALSSVQLFIERIVRNLEPQVSPTDVDASQWQWMKRYRLWQANREVFLWPENWLYPELRDDQSPLFKQMMSSLLQSDITDDAAANAYLDYLTNLEEVAKLEPCGLYYQPGTDNTNEASYVVARTAGAHRKYYFRERQSESWTPWTQVKIDCEDMPLTPIVWDPTGTGSKGRLFLFWLKILKQTSVDPGSMPAPLSPPNVDMKNNTLASVSLDDLNSGLQSNAAAQAQIAVNAVLCWSEYYNGKWQTTKTSDINRPTSLGTFPATGPKSFDINRDLWRIVPAQFTGQNPLVTIFNAQNWLALPSTSLILVIIPPNEPGAGAGYTPGQWAPYNTCGFVLHNMHSRPVRLEDVSGISSNSPVGSVPLAALLDPLSPFRGLGPVNSYDGGNANGGTFGINYQSSYYYSDGFTNNILGFNWTPRYVEPQFGLTDAWDAPFIFEDRRYLFYVTTVEQQVPIIIYQGFGIPSSSPGNPLTLEIPPLMLRQPLIQPVGPEGILATNIRVALDSSVAISYQGQEISQIGSVIGLNSAAGSGKRSA